MAETPQNVIAEALWSKVLEDFASDKAHQAFLTHCREADLLPDAARRYRARQNALNEDQTAEREAIDKRMGAIALLAMSQLDDQRTTPSNRAKTILTLVAVVFTLSTVLGLALLLAT